MTVQLVMELPNKDTPGFLRRQMKAMELGARLKQQDMSAFKDIVEFLLPFVTAPEDRDEAREALLDASERQFENALSAISGGSEGTANPPSAGN